MRSGFNPQPARAQSVFWKNFSWGKTPTVNPVITSCGFPVYLQAMKTTVIEKGLPLDPSSGESREALNATEVEHARLRTSEIRYRRLFEAARDGILIMDPDTRKITDANPFMSELLGYPHAELLGKELWEIGLLKDEAASRTAFRKLQQNHYIRYEDLPLRAKTGK